MRYVTLLLTSLALVPSVDAVEPAETTKPQGVSVEVRSWAEVTKMASKTKGKVVVVDVWSSWCTPCLRELPHLVALQKKYPKQLTTISFNLDFDGAKGSSPDDLEAEVLAVLKKLDATATRNVISKDADETVYDTLDLGAVPAVLVFDGRGKLAKRFDNDSGEYGGDGFTYAKHVNPYVEKLIANEKD